MNVIYIPILVLIFLISYLIGCCKPRKLDGVLYVDLDNAEKCTWLGMKIYDTNNIYQKAGTIGCKAIRRISQKLHSV